MKQKKDIVKAVLVWSVDRLFRDEDMIQPPTFAKECKDHHCIVLTMDDWFDFSHPKRGRSDLDRFLQLAKAAADYITIHMKKMEDARNDVARRGDFSGRGIPVGLYLPKNSKKYGVYEPVAPYIRWTVKKFRQLNGQLNLLSREIAQRGYFIPYPPQTEETPYIGLKRGAHGYTISRPGLENVLTNIAYVGYWYFKEEGKKF